MDLELQNWDSDQYFSTDDETIEEKSAQKDDLSCKPKVMFDQRMIGSNSPLATLNKS